MQCLHHGWRRSQHVSDTYDHNRPIHARKDRSNHLTRRIIIDTDPGKDDAVALLLALASPELHLEAVLSVHGNVPLERTTRNARALLALAGRADIPVYPGCPRPLVREPVHARHVHGDDGLGALVLPEPPPFADPTPAPVRLIETIRAAAPRSLTLCLLGPATNLAAALVQAPDLAQRLDEVVIMAGAIAVGGNTTAAAEFNVFADPEAAAVVLGSGARITLLPLDLTHQVRLTRERLARVRSSPTRAAAAVATLFDGDVDPPMHDPCVIAYLLAPAQFRGQALPVSVETAGLLTLGATVADRRDGARPPNATVLLEADADAFFNLLQSRLATLP